MAQRDDSVIAALLCKRNPECPEVERVSPWHIVSAECEGDQKRYRITVRAEFHCVKKKEGKEDKDKKDEDDGGLPGGP